MANGRTASHWSLGREANLWHETSRPYVLWLIHMWQQRQGRPAQQRNMRLSSKSLNILVWMISVSSSQLQWSRLIGPLNETACQFLKDLGKRISTQSGDGKESAFLFQRLSVVIQRFNAISYSTTVLRRQTT